MVDATSSSRHAADERGASMAVAVPALPLTPSPGRMYVDFEERLDFGRLRQYRLDRARQAMDQAGLGALLVFDNNNIRYLTGVAIGEWTRDKLCRYALYTRTGELVLWDFGSAAVHHRMYCPWLKPENCIASYTTMRGAAPPASGLTAKAVAEISDRLREAGVANEPIGVDWAEVPTFFELQRQHIDIRDGQQVMLAVPDVYVLPLQLEEGRDLGPVHADRLAGHAGVAQPVGDLGYRFRGQ